MRDRIGEFATETRFVRHAMRTQHDGGARFDETLGIRRRVTPRHQVAQRHAVGCHGRNEIGCLRKLDGNDERGVHVGRESHEFLLPAKLKAAAEHSEWRVGCLRLREAHHARGFEFITGIDDDSMCAREQRLQRVECILIFHWKRRRGVRGEAIASPRGIHEGLPHERVRAHQTRRKATIAIPPRARRERSRRSAHAGSYWCLSHELAEIPCHWSDELNGHATKFAREHALGSFREQTKVRASTKDSVFRKQSCDGETLRAQRLERRIGND